MRPKERPDEHPEEQRDDDIIKLVRNQLRTMGFKRRIKRTLCIEKRFVAKHDPGKIIAVVEHHIGRTRKPKIHISVE